jgi:putative endonuclease
MSPNNRRQQVGRWGEQVAARFLEEKGYTILARNWWTPHGEIDLIAEKGGQVIFIEVKTRTGLGFGLPEESVTQAKQAHLLAAVAHYWQERAEAEKDWQVDVVAVVGSPNGGEIEVKHFENAIG